MRTSLLPKRNLLYFWRTNLAVVAGVAIAVAVLAGALIVGDSVRASLRDLFLQRLGNTSFVLNAPGFFREQLAEEIQTDQRFQASGFNATCPLIVLEGTVTQESSGRNGAGVQVYGVDERFWKFHGREGKTLRDRDVLISPGLAKELNTKAGDSLLLRIAKPSAIPIESLHGRKEDAGRTVRLTLRETLPAASLGEFSVRPQQTSVRAIFVPLQLLQKDLEQAGKVNTILVFAKDNSPETESLEKILGDRISLADMGITLRLLDKQQSLSMETSSAILSDPLVDVAQRNATELNLQTVPVLSYLANSIRSGQHEIPYSIVTAIDGDRLKELQVGGPLPRIVLNEWAARDLAAKIGDEVSLEYYVWQPDGSLSTKSAQFQLAGIVPITGVADDRDLVPDYPGITGSENISEWDPPFPIELERIRKQDEDYWREYRTTPKAFISLAKGQELWGARFGKLTSLRVIPSDPSQLQSAFEAYRNGLKAKLNPAVMGFIAYPARAQGLEASRGATDFGEYFLYFSFFLVASALLLAALFFKLGVEQRLREIGTLQAIGFPAATIRSLFLIEGVMLATVGSLLGLGLALVYGKLMMFGLSTWWIGATGTADLNLHVSLASMLIGGVSGMIAAMLSIVWTLRRLAKASPRSLLHGSANTDATQPFSRVGLAGFSSRSTIIAAVFAAAGLALLLLATFNVVGQVAGFFGSGLLLLIALLCFQWTWLRARHRGLISGNGLWPILRMGFRNSAHRPARSVLCITLIASAVFIVVAVDAFRRGDENTSLEKKSGSGGYALLGESDVPLVYDPNTPAGRESLDLIAKPGSDDWSGVSFARFRLRPGDDASCLNLYQPRNPRILGATEDFLQSNRFAFQDSLAATDAEKANPWLLLNREIADGAIPVIVDANSMTYVLHLKLGDEFLLQQNGTPIRLRVVGALTDSLFQSEFVMSERNFLRLFHSIEGYQFFLVDTPATESSAEISRLLEERLADFGFDVVSTKERLAEFHRVENTYLSTFQMLGGLGLALGTLGLAAILLRNILERRRELALLRAVGYNRRNIAVMIIGESAFLLLSGLVIGTACALLAIAPVVVARGGRLSIASLGLLLLAVILSGLLASIGATVSVLRSPLLPALRAE